MSNSPWRKQGTSLGPLKLLLIKGEQVLHVLVPICAFQPQHLTSISFLSKEPKVLGETNLLHALSVAMCVLFLNKLESDSVVMTEKLVADTKWNAWLHTSHPWEGAHRHLGPLQDGYLIFFFLQHEIRW